MSPPLSLSLTAANMRLSATTFINSHETSMAKVKTRNRRWEQEGIHRQLEGCNKNVRPKAAG